MVTTPTTAGEWLAEAIGEREAEAREGRDLSHRELREIAEQDLAYLAALRAIAETHMLPHVTSPDDMCPRRMGCDKCDTARAVAEVFRGREGFDRWFA